MITLRKKQFFIPLSVAALCAVLSSCGDDPELVRQRDEQRAEIDKLQSELAVLRERLKNMPEDRSEELAALQKSAGEQEREISALEEELAGLEARKKALNEEYEAYRRKYPIP